MQKTKTEVVKATDTPVWVWVVIVAVLVLTAGIVGFMISRSLIGKPELVATITPTPTVSVTSTPTVLPTSTVTVTPTATASPTPTPTTIVKKTGKIKEFAGDFTLKFTLNVPSDITLIETKVASWNGIILKRGTKTFMAFNLPYELYEIQGYSTITNVSSSTISNLKRVRAKKVFENSGSYSFAVAYITPGSQHTGADCTSPVVGNVTTSPCASPALTYSSDIGFGAYCSVDSTYLALCDQIMKTIVVTK